MSQKNTSYTGWSLLLMHVCEKVRPSESERRAERLSLAILTTRACGGGDGVAARYRDERGAAPTNMNLQFIFPGL